MRIRCVCLRLWMLGLLAAVLSGTGCDWQPSGGQAGYAYTENEQGERIPADGTRASASTRAAPASGDSTTAEPGILTGFELIERSGQLMSSEELKGQPYVASFFFTLCPSICTQQNEKVQFLQEQFAGQPIRFVSIWCDPEIDRPQVLAEYAQRFGADSKQWLFFTGELNYIRRVGSDMYRLPVMRRFHAEKFVLVDALGKVHAYYTWTDPEQWQALQRDMAALLKAGGSFPADAAEAS